ncbi:MAG: hypothetical protein HY270_09265 [Deltaproteobacteria bacterium]|nr:hypothetical protein [Deltaproteobacteria bacterium]
MGTFIALDVAIGLVFMYLLLAILCTAINEWIASVFRLRARTLKRAVSRLVDAPSGAKRPAEEARLSDRIFEHPLISSMKDGARGPSYISGPRFVAALMDTLAVGKSETGATASFVPKHDLGHVEKQLTAIRRAQPPQARNQGVKGEFAPASSGEADGDGRMEQWFNEAMERASGWYRRELMWITIIVSAVVTLASNADTISAARILWRSPTVRSAVVAQAQARVKKPRPAESNLFVQADYPNKDKPISDQAAGEVDEGNSDSDNTTSSEDSGCARDDGGLTDAEAEALGQIIGWGRDFKEVNKTTCAQRQSRINELCKSDAATKEECTQAVDGGTAQGVCVQSANGLEPTDAFPAGLAPFSLLGRHLLGWLLTAIAVSMGAPFWFDTLKLITSVRSSGKNPDESKRP